MTGKTKQQLVVGTAIVLLAGSLSPAAQDNSANPGSWSGIIINDDCNADEAFAEARKCTDTGAPDAKLALFDDTTRQIYLLEPQAQAVGHLGESVTVNGAVEGHILHVASIKMLTDIGLAVGRRAPALSARDQFGQRQSLDTLRGRNGTVLLFYRSADW